jgi:hypothetical protein
LGLAGPTKGPGSRAGACVGAPKRAVQHELFSRSDLEVFDRVLAEYGNYAFDQLHDVTIKHFAYRNAWENRPPQSKSVLMAFDDMLEESATKTDYLDDIDPVSHKM